MSSAPVEFVEYTVTEEDWAAFGEHQMRTLGTAKRTIRMVQLIGAAVVTALILGTWFLWQSWLFVIALVVGGAIAVADTPRQVAKSTRNQMIRLFREGKAGLARGLHRVEARPDGLAAITDASSSITRWEAIDRITESDTHLFLDFGAGIGTAIPRQRISAGDFSAFALKVRANVEAAR